MSGMRIELRDLQQFHSVYPVRGFQVSERHRLRRRLRCRMLRVGTGTAGLTCEPCESNCTTRSSSTACTECESSKYLSSEDCVDLCPAGYYGAVAGTTGLAYQACKSSCSTCTSATVCTECVNSKYLSNEDCVDFCPIGYYGAGTGITGRTCQA